MPKNDSFFNFQIYNRNMALNMPKCARKMLELATYGPIFVAKKVVFYMQKQLFGHFQANKKC